MCTLEKQISPEIEAERKSVLHKARCQRVRHARRARIERVLPGGDVIDQPKFVIRSELSIFTNELFRNGDAFLHADCRFDAGIFAGAIEPLHVIFQPVGFLVEGAEEVGDGGPQDDAQIPDGEHAL